MDLWDTYMEEFISLHDEINTLKKFALELSQRQQLFVQTIS